MLAGRLQHENTIDSSMMMTYLQQSSNNACNCLRFTFKIKYINKFFQFKFRLPVPGGP